MKYLLIIFVLLTGCVTPNTFEKEALRITKEKTKCKTAKVAISGRMGDKAQFIKVEACGKYIDYMCSSTSAFSCDGFRCVEVRIESKPSEEAAIEKLEKQIRRE